MSEETIKSSLELYDFVTNAVEDECRKLLDFSNEFHEKYMEEKSKLPYHINVIDELHINENGHSRILLKLLQFVNERGEWEILQSLVDYMKSKSKSRQFERITIKEPKITQEEARIDLWVRDVNYAIIFENKIYNAQDQEAQLSRYIEKTRERYFDEKNIFVVYLSQTGSEPDPQSWGDYKASFEDRYINLSFRDDILPWLKEGVLPNIKYKDTYLINAIQQYIDYLEGLFELRTIQNTINTNLQSIITNYFKKDLTENCKTDRDRAVFMEEIVKNLDEFRTQVDDLKRKYIKDSRREFFGHLATEVVSQYENIFNIITDDYPTAYAVLSFCHEGKDYVIRIDIEGEKLYCQAQYNKSKVSDKIFYSFSESLIAKTLEKKILKKPSDWCRYRYFENGNEEEKQLEAKRCFLEAAKCCADLVKYNN